MIIVDVNITDVTVVKVMNMCVDWFFEISISVHKHNKNVGCVYIFSEQYSWKREGNYEETNIHKRTASPVFFVFSNIDAIQVYVRFYIYILCAFRTR